MIQNLLDKLRKKRKPAGIEALAPEYNYDPATIMCDDVHQLRKLYRKGELARLIINLPFFRDRPSEFVKFLMESNILTMGKALEHPPITIGADPEFILCERGQPSKIVMYSNRHSNVYLPSGVRMAQAAIGADYGLLEFRTNVYEEVHALISNVRSMIKQFNKNASELDILRKEAVLFGHKRQRMLELMEDEETDHGIAHNKYNDVVSVPTDGSIVMENLVDVTMSAYDKPMFGKFNPDLLTAGGHIHLGGAFVKLLSFEQTKAFIRTIDRAVRPMCEAVETDAGALRRTAYGFPGEFKIKEYGIEYRSLSNAIFWPENEKVLRDILNIIVKTAKTFALTKGGKGEPIQEDQQGEKANT